MALGGLFVLDPAVDGYPAAERGAITLCHNTGNHRGCRCFDRVRPGQTGEIDALRPRVFVQVAHRARGTAGPVDLVAHMLDRGRREWFRARARCREYRLGPERTAQIRHRYGAETDRAGDNRGNPGPLQDGCCGCTHGLHQLSSVDARAMATDTIPPRVLTSITPHMSPATQIP